MTANLGKNFYDLQADKVFSKSPLETWYLVHFDPEIQLNQISLSQSLDEDRIERELKQGEEILEKCNKNNFLEDTLTVILNNIGKSF